MLAVRLLLVGLDVQLGSGFLRQRITINVYRLALGIGLITYRQHMPGITLITEIKGKNNFLTGDGYRQHHQGKQLVHMNRPVTGVVSILSRNIVQI